MTEMKRPRWQPYVVVERCGTCGVAKSEKCQGHGWAPMRWPELPPAKDVDVSSEYVEPAHGTPGEIRARATHRPTGKFGYAKLVRSPAEHMRRYPSSVEVEPVVAFARLLLARQLCPHVDQQVWAGVARLLEQDPSEQEPMPPATGYHLDIRVWCADCGEPFVFVGDRLPLGLSPAHPTVDVEGTTLSAPLRPGQYPEDWGLNRPGYGVRVR